MDDRKLEIFLATVKTGSFSKAAKETNCSQSAVTQIMNTMESELNCKLLDRNHNGVKLTSAGEHLLPFIIDAESGLSKLAEQAKYITEGKSLPIRIGVFSSIANTWLPALLKTYQDTHPDVTFDIHIGTDILSTWLLNNKIDIALGDEDRLKGFRFYPLMNDPYYAVMPESLSVSDTDTISQDTFISYPFIMAPMNALKSHLDKLPKKSINVTCDDDSALLSMVAQGLGVTAMPKLSLSQVPKNVRVMKLTPETKRVLGIGMSHSKNTVVQPFVNFLKEYFSYDYL